MDFIIPILSPKKPSEVIARVSLPIIAFYTRKKIVNIWRQVIHKFLNLMKVVMHNMNESPFTPYLMDMNCHARALD